MTITGERIVTNHGGFNASWQRHTACYAQSARFLPSEPLLDLGCGVGHAYSHLANKRTVGVDVEHGCLLGQDRPVVRADMRQLPFSDRTYKSLVCIHAIEHVPDAARAVAESRRVLDSGGTAVFVTPNRLTFGRPDEIIDPFHYVEYDSSQLASLCSRAFSNVEVYGLFGSQRYMDFYDSEHRRLDAVLRMDPLKLRRLVPRSFRKQLYNWTLSRARRDEGGPASTISIQDFHLSSDNLGQALDLIAVCS